MGCDGPDPRQSRQPGWSRREHPGETDSRWEGWPGPLLLHSAARKASPQDSFQNTGGTATLGKAALVQPRDLRLVAAWVLPIARTPLIGVGQGYPSASGMATTAPGTQWQRRQRVPSAVVGHTRGRDLINIVLVVKPSGNVGAAKAIDLRYEAGGTHYLLRWAHGLKTWAGRSRS